MKETNKYIEAIANIAADLPSEEIVDELDNELIASLAELLKQRKSREGVSNPLTDQKTN